VQGTIVENIETLQFTNPILLVGPADLQVDLLGELARRDFPIIAADGGANRLLENGIIPDAIVGDLDSLDSSLSLDPEIRLIRLGEQDSTDFEKCLYAISAPLFLALGFTGKRFDHTLATLHGMVKFHREKNILLVGSEDISLIVHGEFSIDIERQQILSVFPLGEIRFANSSGLKYPLEGLKFQIGEKIGTSNISVSKRVLIQPSPEHQTTPYVVTLPISSLEMLIRTYR